MASTVTNQFKHLTLKGDLLFGDLTAGNRPDLYFLLYTAIASTDAQVADADTMADLSYTEVVGSGYTTGGDQLGQASITVTLDDTNDRAYIDAADAFWAGATMATSVIGGILYDYDGVSVATSVPFAKIELNSFTANNVDVTIQWSADGILRIA